MGLPQLGLPNLGLPQLVLPSAGWLVGAWPRSQGRYGQAMSSSAARHPLAAWRAQRVEVYLAVHVDGELVTVPGADGPRLPGAVLAHGEHPRDAVLRAVRAGEPAAGLVAREALRLNQVRSDVRPRSGGPGLQVLRLVFEADRGLPFPVAEIMLRHPVPAPVTDVVPGAPPRVQRPAAYAVIVNGGHVLLSQLSHTGMWTLPGGGVDHGEHPRDTVRRETFEETGLVLESAELTDVDSHHFTGRNPDAVTEDFHGVRFLYRGGVSRRDVPEVQEIGGTTVAAAWWPLRELSRLRLNPVVRTGLAMVE